MKITFTRLVNRRWVSGRGSRDRWVYMIEQTNIVQRVLDKLPQGATITLTHRIENAEPNRRSDVYDSVDITAEL